ncbi:MAG: GntR family transcriptional regulator [Proteobacteria bacterium]|nr:MAG: GntR family transcriptional regulator [Pseudomonadota bacterium]
MCEIFGTSRRQVAEVLRRLAYDGLVTLHPNRGAFVATPDAEEARAVFDARRLIEPEITRIVATRATREELASLRRNVEAEAESRRMGRLREAIQLSGEFHILLGQCARNPILHAQVRQLVARTSLIVTLYENQNTMMCWRDDHAVFVKLLEGRRVNRAVTLMRKHLAHVQENLDLERRPQSRFDLRAIYAPESARHY